MLTVLLLLSWNYGARADGAPGDLDPGFGTDGKVMTDLIVDGQRPYGLMLSALALQPDGKLIAAGAHFGAIVLMRYNPDGSLDPTFGDGGIVVTDFGRQWGLPYGDWQVARLSAAAGRIVAATDIWPSSESGPVGFMACYTTDGQLDPSFGSGGKIIHDSFEIGAGLDRGDLLVQEDGRVIATTNSGLVRFNADGTRDMSFGSGGQVTVSNVSIFQLAQQSDGRIIGAGTSSLNGFALARFLSDGSLDPSFGTAGVVTTETGNGEVWRVRVAADGQIVAVGGPREWNNRHLVIAKYNADGSLDTEFGDGGMLTSDLYGPANDLAVQPDGHIVIGLNSSADFELIRFNPNGGVDQSFGYNGRATTDFSGRGDSVSALAAVGDDRIVAAGSSWTLNRGRWVEESRFALACFMTSGTPREPNPDFELGFTSSVIHATRGTRPRIEVYLTRIDGFSGEVTVTPPDPSAEGIICKAPEPAKVSGTTARWRFKVKGWAAPGPHQLTFIGRDATGRERSATVTLIVD